MTVWLGTVSLVYGNFVRNILYGDILTSNGHINPNVLLGCTLATEHFNSVFTTLKINNFAHFGIGQRPLYFINSEPLLHFLIQSSGKNSCFVDLFLRPAYIPKHHITSLHKPITCLNTKVDLSLVKLTRAHDLLSRAHDLLSRSHDLVSRSHDLLSRAHEILT